jgi:hypothetical protein
MITKGLGGGSYMTRGMLSLYSITETVIEALRIVMRYSFSKPSIDIDIKGRK